MLYNAIDTLDNKFNFSEYTANVLKTECESQLVKIMKVYDDPDAIAPVMDNLDIEGHDVFYYLIKFQMFMILECKIMN